MILSDEFDEPGHVKILDHLSLQIDDGSDGPRRCTDELTTLPKLQKDRRLLGEVFRKRSHSAQVTDQTKDDAES